MYSDISPRKKGWPLVTADHKCPLISNRQRPWTVLQIMRIVASVRLSVLTLTPDPFDQYEANIFKLGRGLGVHTTRLRTCSRYLLFLETIYIFGSLQGLIYNVPLVACVKVADLPDYLYVWYTGKFNWLFAYSSCLEIKSDSEQKTFLYAWQVLNLKFVDIRFEESGFLASWRWLLVFACETSENS